MSWESKGTPPNKALFPGGGGIEGVPLDSHEDGGIFHGSSARWAIGYAKSNVQKLAGFLFATIFGNTFWVIYTTKFTT